jgi:proline iminopeptidase
MRLVTVLLLAAIGTGCATDGQPDRGASKPASDKPEIRSVEVGGTDLAVTIEGRGRDCVVIGSAVYYPRTFSPEFKEQFRCAYVSTRMFTANGSETIDPADYTMDTVVSDLEAVRAGLGLERFVIFGHSMHALMALEYAKAHPEHVSHVVMLGMSPRFDAVAQQQARDHWNTDASDERKEILDRQMGALTDEVLAELSPEEVIARQYAARGPMYWADPSYDASWLWKDVPFDADLMNAFLAGLDDYHALDGIADLKAPVLVVVGRYDFVVPPFLWDGVKDRFPDLTFRVFDESGHTPQLEQPELFLQTLTGWL